MDTSALLYQLLILGYPSVQIEGGPDYRLLGIGPADIPKLIEIACDIRLHTSRDPGARTWVPVHAWRALGQLRAVKAVEPLLQLARRLETSTDDWFLVDLPVVFASIGLPALPSLEAFLTGPRSDVVYASDVAAAAMVRIAAAHPEVRDVCVAAITTRLLRAENPPELNGLLIASLLDLQAAEAAPQITRLYEDCAVDERICGTLDEALWLLGVGPEPALQPRR